VKLLDLLIGFTTDAQSEAEGLDRTEHGEVGFDLGLALETVPGGLVTEPRPATVPPDGQKRFTVVVEGPDTASLTNTWSQLCQAGAQPPSPEFRAVYPYVTTMQGNRFRFRGGDPKVLSDNLRTLLQDKLGGTPVRVHVEN
jgi:hypothetical protein